jgi:hypothetical protein
MRQKASRKWIVTILAVGAIAISANGFAQPSISSSLGVVPYPSKGQSPQKQSQDEGECYAWAMQQTGLDPIAASKQPPPPSSSAPGGERVKGAARGAAGGAIIGAVAGDAGKGAAIGATAGTMAGGRQARNNKQAKAKQEQDAQTAANQQFNKAFGACMEGRNYTVK